MKKEKNSMKGQAVMEYLITYGLALFVILIVLAILVAVVFPALKPPEQCQFNQPGFSCSQKQHVIMSSAAANEVRVLFYLSNDQGSQVTITNMLCTTQPAGNIEKTSISAITAVRVPSGGAAVFGNSTVLVPCKNPDGTNVVLKPNSNFRGSIAMVYTRSDDITGAPSRVAIANLVGNVQSE